jgi:hypothetical protein
MGWIIGFITDLHTLQITTAPTKPSSACCLHQPFPSNGFYLWMVFRFPPSRRYSPANIPHMNSCQLNDSDTSAQPPLQSSTQLSPLN